MENIFLGDTWIFLILRMVVSSVAIMCNALLLWIAIRCRKFRQTKTNCLIALLSLAEFITGCGLFIRGLYTIMAKAHQVAVFRTTFCIWLSLLQVCGVAFGGVLFSSLAIDRLLSAVQPSCFRRGRIQIPVSVAIGLIIAIGCFVFGLTGDQQRSITLCAIGPSSSKLYNKLFSIIAFINSLIVIVTYGIGALILRQKLAQAGSASGAGSHVLEVQKRIFTYVGFVLTSFLVFCSLPTLLQFLIMAPTTSTTLQEYFSLLSGFSYGLNASMGYFVYLYKHPEIRYYSRVFLPEWIFQTIGGLDSSIGYGYSTPKTKC